MRAERVDTLVFFWTADWKAKNVFRKESGQVEIGSPTCRICMNLLHFLFADVKPDPQIIKEVEFWCQHITEEIVPGMREKHIKSAKSRFGQSFGKMEIGKISGFKLAGATAKQFNKLHAATGSPKTQHDHGSHSAMSEGQEKYVPNLVP